MFLKILNIVEKAAFILTCSALVPSFSLALAQSAPLAEVTCSLDSELGRSSASGDLAWVCGQVYGTIICEYDVINTVGDSLGARRSGLLKPQPRFRFGSPSTGAGPLEVSIEVFESEQVSDFVFNRLPADLDLQVRLFATRTTATFLLNDLIHGQKIDVQVPKLVSGDFTDVDGILECNASAL